MPNVGFNDGEGGFFEQDTLNGYATILLDNGGRYMVPASWISQAADGTYSIAMRAADLKATRPDTANIPPEGVTLPVVQEIAHLQIRKTVTGNVRVTKTVTDSDELIDEPLHRTDIQINRVTIGKIVEETPVNRREGNTLIIPVVEEVLVVERKLLLVEEVHVTEVTTTRREPQTVTLRREHITVDRTEPPAKNT